MREEVSLLFETVRQWVVLEADALLLYDGDRSSAARPPLERRVLGLIRAAHRAQDRGERRRLVAVLPASSHPICESWSSLPALRRHIRRLAEATPALAWLEAAPARWAALQEMVTWLPAPDEQAPIRAQALEALRRDARTAGLPAALTLSFLSHTIQSAPSDTALRLRVLDDAALRRVLSGGPEALSDWAVSAEDARQTMRRLALPAAVREGLVTSPALDSPPPPATQIRWPSQMLQPTAAVVPFQGMWDLEGALLTWCAGHSRRSGRVLIGPPGSGKQRLAHTLQQQLHRVGWSSSVLGDAPPPASLGSDHLLIVPDVSARVAEVRAALESSGRRRLRVLCLAGGEGTWCAALSGVTSLRIPEIAPTERAARLRLAAAALARQQGRKLPWVMALPDVSALRWPLQLQMAALGALRGSADRSPAQGALDAERRAWRSAGVDRKQMVAQLTDAALGAGPWPASYADAPLPAALAGALVTEHLRTDPSPLQRAEPATALALLDLLAEDEPAAREWMRQVILADPPARIPIAARIAAACSPDPHSRPLGGLLAELGHRFASAGKSPSTPMRALTVHYSHQILAPWHLLEEEDGTAMEMAANAGGRAPHTGRAAAQPAPLAEQAWEHLRHRIDVLLPHQIRALDLLDQEHRGSPHESLARQRVELLLELCARAPSRLVHLEGAVNDLGALLSAGHLSPEAAPLSGDGLSDDERQQARAAHRQLHEAFAHRGARNNAAAASALAEAARLLRGLSQRHPALIASDLLHTTLEMAALGRNLGRPREAAATLQALLTPLEQITRDYPVHWPRRSTILGNLALLQSVSGNAHDARAFAEQAVAAAPKTDASTLGRLDRISALRIQILCDDEARAAPRWAEIASLISALASYRPALYRPYLAVEHDRAARQAAEQGDRIAARGHMEQTAEALAELNALNADLYAPFQGLSLHNLGARMRAIGAHRAATDLTLDAAEAYRRQARLGGETFLPDLSATLSNLGAMLATDGQLDHALALTRKSIGVSWGGAPPEALARMPSIRRLLIEPLPPLPGAPDSLVVRARMRAGTARRRPYFLWHLTLLAAALAEGEGDLSDRIASVWRFEVSKPAQLRPGLATALHNLGVLLGLGGQAAAGAEALEGAAAVLRVLHQDAPAQTARDLALALADLSALRDLLADAVAAEAAAAEALSLLPDDATEERAQALLNRSAALLALGRNQAAITAAADAADAALRLPAIRTAAQHNLAAAALAASQPQVAFEASRDALRSAPPELSPAQRALLAQTHRRAAAAAARAPIAEARIDPVA